MSAEHDMADDEKHAANAAQAIVQEREEWKTKIGRLAEKIYEFHGSQDMQTFGQYDNIVKCLHAYFMSTRRSISRNSFSQ